MIKIPFQSKCYHLIDDAWVLGPTMTTSRSQASILTIGDEGSEVKKLGSYFL